MIYLLSLLCAVCFAAFTVTDVSEIWILPVGFVVAAAGITLIYWLILGFFALFCSTRKEYEKPSALAQFMLNAAYWFVCSAARVRVHASGLEKIPESERFLFVSNHLSRFDPMIESLALRKTPVAFISKPSNFKIPIGRRFMNRCCYIAIDRESPRNAAKAINRAAELLKRDAVSIAVYPEGHRGTGYGLQKFKPGCLKAASKAGCPIVAAVITGTERIHKRFPWRGTDVYLDIIGVFETDGKEKTVELSERIRNEMRRRLPENSQKSKGENEA
ncbi:MAG: 1-acyl-sn-glycerol-3-phosphate acyltransferase [Lachnospiraceae bacterium]|nr:1-acyl-sn-glycerol-3-phosphate acyltransferase [Ruminococcus sp.]MCM1274050.1 1-acyl-sn-glycerol-3-phosphate acyltransferase [Lachnospiraceae bacterium]